MQDKEGDKARAVNTVLVILVTRDILGACARGFQEGYEIQALRGRARVLGAACARGGGGLETHGVG